MIYPFEDIETGERVELHFLMHEAPSIGECIKHEGRVLRRLCANFVPAGKGRGFKAHKSMSLPRGVELPGVKKYGKNGEPIIEKKQQIDTIAKESKEKPEKYGGQQWSWDGL